MSVIRRLHETIATVCPIDGVGPLASGSVGPGNVRIDYMPEATDSQKAAAQITVVGFDWSQAAQDAWEADLQPERKAIRAAAAAAVADIDTFLAISSPTAAQVREQVKQHAQILRTMILRLVQID